MTAANSTTEPANANQAPSAIEKPNEARLLPSGRSVVLHVDGAHEAIELRSPEGEVEVSIVMTESGPVVKLKGARLELEAPDSLSVRCRHLDLQATESARLRSDGELHLDAQEGWIETRDDIHINGKIIRLNSPVTEGATPQDSPGQGIEKQ